jgi:hypothetical protein
MLKLVVTEPFGAHVKGEEITEDIDAVLAAHAAHVVRVETSDAAPSPKADPAPDAGEV